MFAPVKMAKGGWKERSLQGLHGFEFICNRARRVAGKADFGCVLHRSWRLAHLDPAWLIEVNDWLARMGDPRVK
jgi:hypothetical protein